MGGLPGKAAWNNRGASQRISAEISRFVMLQLCMYYYEKNLIQCEIEKLHFQRKYEAFFSENLVVYHWIHTGSKNRRDRSFFDFHRVNFIGNAAF